MQWLMRAKNLVLYLHFKINVVYTAACDVLVARSYIEDAH